VNRRERNQQKKKKARQERLRQQKHISQAAPHVPDEWDDTDLDTVEGSDDVEDLSDSPVAGIPPFDMERMLQQLHRAAEERGLSGEAEVKQFMEQFNRNRGSLGKPADPAGRAQDLAYQAMEQPDSAGAARLARQALELDPNCVDALTTLAGINARSEADLIMLLQEAVAAGERGLGADAIKNSEGHFWGLVTTRPYMRARAALAEVLQKAGRWSEAIGHFEALLGLNPNDNQGNRDPLLGCYLAAGNLDKARQLMDQYADCAMAVFAWGAVLERFLAGDLPAAASALKKARTANRHVEAYLTGAQRIPQKLPQSYQLGDKNEAIRAADVLLDAWRRHPEAARWLKN
jgi:tetratricopeptide (TPR) repeat protein